jgi:hypothetical protein
MNKGQCWILNALVKGGCLLSLIDPDNIDWHFSPSHGLNRSQLIDALDSLFQSGDLIAERCLDGSEEVFVPTISEIAIILASRETNVSLFLTPKGGGHWEEFSDPDWDRYIGAEWGNDDWWGASSADRRLVVRYLDAPEVQARIMPGTVVWDEPSPFQATYWKTLPFGCRVRFRLLPASEDGECHPWPNSDEGWYSNCFVS